MILFERVKRKGNKRNWGSSPDPTDRLKQDKERIPRTPSGWGKKQSLLRPGARRESGSISGTGTSYGRSKKKSKM